MINPKSKIRLYVPDNLKESGSVTLSKDQSHYAIRVMRQEMGGRVVVFNGRDGEWAAQIDEASKTACLLKLCEQLREQTIEQDVWLVFSPIKKTRLDFLVEKAVELGVSRLLPVMTERTDVSRVNVERLSATAIEASEQCERLSVPVIEEPVSLVKRLGEWPEDRRLFVMDETGSGRPVTDVFRKHPDSPDVPHHAILIGPEGGFSQEELDALRDLPFVTPVTLGPRILRAETAALAALSCWQMLAGDGCEGRIR